MTEEYDGAMLAALDRLVVRYGPHPAKNLAELIRDPKTAETLAAALESAAATSRDGFAAKAKGSGRAGIGVLKGLRLSDPDKHAIVAEIRNQLLSSKVLPTMRELRSFARMNDLSIGKASSRGAAIAPLLKSMARLPVVEISALLEAMNQAGTGDRTLERWRDVIVGSGASKSAARNAAAKDGGPRRGASGSRRPARRA